LLLHPSFLILPLPRPPPRPTLFPYTTLFRSMASCHVHGKARPPAHHLRLGAGSQGSGVRYISSSSFEISSCILPRKFYFRSPLLDRKSTRLNSSHVKISYAVFCLKKKTQPQK